MSYNEKEADYAFMFESIKTYFAEKNEQPIEPKFIMSDAAHAIGNGFKNTFKTTEKILMCYAHMSSCIQKRKLNSLKNKEQIKNDITMMLQKSPAEPIFNKGIELFKQKWNDEEKEFTEYFHDEWVNKNPNWYAGACLSVPSTNNSLESFNNSLKNHQTFRKRMTIVEFKDSILNIVSQRSLEYKFGHLVYTVEPTVSDNT